MMPPPPPQPSFGQLEQAALRILRLISDTAGLENTILAVVGDLALRKYLAPCDVPVHSIDFIVSKSSSPGRVRKEIASHPMSPLVEKAGTIFFPLGKGSEIEVKIVPDWLCPYLPAAARPARKDTENLPYISLEDLLVFKVDACGLREREMSKRKEAADAIALLKLASEHFPLHLDESKMDRITQGLSEVIEFSEPEYDKSWWQRSLGRVPDKQRTPHEIFADLADHTSSTVSTPPTSPTASSRSSIYSTMSRTSSSTSSMSMHSAASSVSTIHSPDPMSPGKNGRPRKMSATGKPPRHKRHISSSGPPATSIESAMERLELGRPASPGVGLINRI